MAHKRTVLSALFLVAGTCIGGGMLALPIATGISGFLPSIVVMALCWFSMTTTALLLLEASLWMEEGAHIITMTSTLLGPIGKAVSWVLYLFICYASIVAYTAGGGVLIADSVNYFLPIGLSKDLGCILFFFLFGSTIYIGSWFVGRVNAILFASLVIAYFALVGMSIDEVNPQYLTHQGWRNSLIAVPILLTSFSFQTMVPSLTPFLKGNQKSLRIAVIGGTAIAFIIYAIWQWIILGIVPVDGPHGLAQALHSGNQPATQFLREHVSGAWIAPVAEYFAFFALVTSFFGMTLGLFDFLADGLKINKKKVKGKLILGTLIAVPTLIFATQFERAFMVAMDATGGFGDSILNGIIPILMVWRGRYFLNLPKNQQMPGGKVLLVCVMCFFVLALVIEILGQTGYIASVYEGFESLKLPKNALSE